MFKAFNAISKAAVPFDTAIENFLENFLKMFFKIFTSGPSDEIQPFFRTLLTDSISVFVRNGKLTGINFLFDLNFFH